jgi:hypothetical protein
MKKISHSDSREHIGEHHSVHAGNIARDGGKPKGGDVMVHPGMTKRTESGALALGGHHASAIDALSGQVTVPGAVKATPGYGNSGVQNGHPFAKAPAGKNLKPVPAAFGMRSRSDTPADAMHAIGEKMLDEAFAASGADDRAAHGRK